MPLLACRGFLFLRSVHVDFTLWFVPVGAVSFRCWQNHNCLTNTTLMGGTCCFSLVSDVSGIVNHNNGSAIAEEHIGTLLQDSTGINITLSALIDANKRDLFLYDCN